MFVLRRRGEPPRRGELCSGNSRLAARIAHMAVLLFSFCVSFEAARSLARHRSGAAGLAHCQAATLHTTAGRESERAYGQAQLEPIADCWAERRVYH